MNEAVTVACIGTVSTAQSSAHGADNNTVKHSKHTVKQVVNFSDPKLTVLGVVGT